MPIVQLQLKPGTMFGLLGPIVFVLLAVSNLSAQQESASQLRGGDTTTHGSVHHHVYTTAVGINLPLGQEDYYVYTPPGYDPKSPTKYPVLYLLHGYSQGASAWIADGNFEEELDDLTALGEARPMIVVMPLGYGNYKFRRGALLEETLNGSRPS